MHRARADARRLSELEGITTDFREVEGLPHAMPPTEELARLFGWFDDTLMLPGEAKPPPSPPPPPPPLPPQSSSSHRAAAREAEAPPAHASPPFVPDDSGEPSAPKDDGRALGRAFPRRPIAVEERAEPLETELSGQSKPSAEIEEIDEDEDGIVI